MMDSTRHMSSYDEFVQEPMRPSLTWSQENDLERQPAIYPEK